MKKINVKEIMPYLENELHDLIIISQDIEYLNGIKNYQEIRAVYANCHIEIKVLDGQFVKVEIEALGKVYLEKIKSLLNEKIDQPTLSYDLINFEDNEKVSIVEWTEKDAAERYLEILEEDVAAAGYHCSKVKVYQKQKY